MTIILFSKMVTLLTLFHYFQIMCIYGNKKQSTPPFCANDKLFCKADDLPKTEAHTFNNIKM